MSLFDNTQPAEPAAAPHPADVRHPAEPATQVPAVAAPGRPAEIVSRGILFSLASIPVGVGTPY